MGYAALAFEDHEHSAEILDWAMSELDYLWGPTGRYVQSDGGVSEGPFYYSFGFSPSMAFFIAVHNRADPARLYNRNCLNRSTQDPWAGHGCVRGESFSFENPLHSDYFRASADWAISLRTATGQRHHWLTVDSQPRLALFCSQVLVVLVITIGTGSTTTLNLCAMTGGCI